MGIDYYAYNSRLYKVSPAFKVIFGFILIILSITCNSIIISTIICLYMSFMTVKIGGINLKYYFKLMIIPMSFLLLSGIAIAVDIKVISGFEIIVTEESFKNAVLIVIKALGAISSMYMIILSTPSYEIIMLLQKMKLPTLITELMHLIYRYIFILLEVQVNMKISAEARLGFVDLKTSYKTLGKISANILMISFKKALKYYDAMESRCYNGKINYLIEEKNVESSYVASSCLLIVIILFLNIKLRL